MHATSNPDKQLCSVRECVRVDIGSPCYERKSVFTSRCGRVEYVDDGLRTYRAKNVPMAMMFCSSREYLLPSRLWRNYL